MQWQHHYNDYLTCVECAALDHGLPIEKCQSLSLGGLPFFIKQNVNGGGAMVLLRGHLKEDEGSSDLRSWPRAHVEDNDAVYGGSFGPVAHRSKTAVKRRHECRAKRYRIDESGGIPHARDELEKRELTTVGCIISIPN